MIDRVDRNNLNSKFPLDLSSSFESYLFLRGRSYSWKASCYVEQTIWNCTCMSFEWNFISYILCYDLNLSSKEKSKWSLTRAVGDSFEDYFKTKHYLFVIVMIHWSSYNSFIRVLYKFQTLIVHLLIVIFQSLCEKSKISFVRQNFTM